MAAVAIEVGRAVGGLGIPVLFSLCPVSVVPPPGDSLPLRGHLATPGDIFGCHHWRVGLLLSHSEWRSGMLLNSRCPHSPRSEDLTATQNVSRVRSEALIYLNSLALSFPFSQMTCPSTTRP